MLTKPSFSLLAGSTIVLLTGAVIWTLRRESAETNDTPRSAQLLSRSKPARDGPSAHRTKTTIRSSPPAPHRGEDFEQRGTNAAKLGIETITARLEELTTATDKEAFIRGAFRHAAALEAKTALDWAWKLQRGHFQDTALMTLLCEWSGKTAMQWLGNPDFMSEGIATSLGNYLLKSGKTTPQDLADFASNFTSGKSKGMLIAEAAAKLALTNPDEALAMGDGLEILESLYFRKIFVRLWANKDLPGAFRWIEANPNNPAIKELSEPLFSYLAETNIQEAARFLETVPHDSLARRSYLTKVASTWAMKDTQAALDWANNLTTPKDRDAAAESIRQSVPVGIGAAMNGNMISWILPDSPASKAGLNSGDKILALTNTEGQWNEAPGMDSIELMQKIRGQANTNVTLRIQTKDGGIRDVTITRQQIMMKQQ